MLDTDIIKLLDISQAAYYRKIKNPSYFNFFELYSLSKILKISLPFLMGDIQIGIFPN